MLFRHSVTIRNKRLSNTFTSDVGQSAAAHRCSGPEITIPTREETALTKPQPKHSDLGPVQSSSDPRFPRGTRFRVNPVESQLYYTLILTKKYFLQFARITTEYLCGFYRVTIIVSFCQSVKDGNVWETSSHSDVLWETPPSFMSFPDVPFRRWSFNMWSFLHVCTVYPETILLVLCGTC